MAAQLSGGSYATANFAIAGVFIARLLPAVFLGPLAGVIADRFDRRRLMVSMDLLRGALYISIPIVHTYFWLYTAMILVECLTLFWSPAKEASVPNLVPKDKLENANQVSLLAAYGTAPIAAVLFSLLSLFGGALAAISPLIPADSVYIALYGLSADCTKSQKVPHQQIAQMKILVSRSLKAGRPLHHQRLFADLSLEWLVHSLQQARSLD
jgi:dTMP kinase